LSLEKKKQVEKEIGATVNAIIGDKETPGFPKWEDMPKPDNILVLSWEDIWAQAKERGINLSRSQIVEAFDKAVRNAGNECMMGAFWANVDFAIDEVDKSE